MQRFLIAVTLLSGIMTLGIPYAAQATQRGKEKDRSPRSTPAERVDQLLQTLQKDRHEDHRTKAVEELGKFPSPEFPEIIPALIDALVRDDSASVRKTAVKALAEIEPPTHEVKDALEQAVKQDKSWSVRQSARWAAWRYKPKDDPASGNPKLRATSKPSTTGKITQDEKAKGKTQSTLDPHKASKALPVTAPVVPAESAPPAPLMAPAPGQFASPATAAQTAVPTMLAAPRPPG
jgi:hypothetical protein